MRPRYLFLYPRGGAATERVSGMADKLRNLLPVRRRIGTAVLLTSTACPVLEMPAIEGCVIGSLYSADGSTPKDCLVSAEQLAVMSSNGKSLIRQASGAYVAMWRGPGDGSLVALRDPSACLPAFCVRNHDIVAIGSDVESLAVAGVTSLSIDPIGLAQHLRFPLVPNTRTCLDGIEELRPGYLCSISEQLAAEMRLASQ